MKGPIFILAQAPRTGSTWVQRMLTSTNDILIWGEGTDLIFRYGDRWTHDDPEQNDHNPDNLHLFREKKASMWMASMNPLLSDAMEGRKLYCDRVYGETAEREGYKRWGVKQTEWGDVTIQFIRTQYPDAKMVFLCRSFDLTFTSRFKGARVTQMLNHEADVDSFCSIWVGNSENILKQCKEPRAKIVKYEDLIGNYDAVCSLAEWCGLGPPDKDEMDVKISCSGWGDYQDVMAKSPVQMEALWPYRDLIIEYSKRLGYKKVQL